MLNDEEITHDTETEADIFSRHANTLRTHWSQPEEADAPVTEERQPRTPWYAPYLYPLGMGMIAMFFLYLFIASTVAPLCITISDHWNYGQARISQFDLNVGHNGTSHFIAEYYHKQAVVIEFPQNHPEHAKTYVLQMTETGTDSPRIVTLQAVSINPHEKAGYLDLLVQVEGFALPAVLYNTGSGFAKEAL